MSRRPPRRAGAEPVPSLSSGETLRELVQNLREGVYITRQDGRILDANPAMLELFGVRSVEELAARRVQQWLDPRERAKELAILRREGVVRDFEFTMRRPGGESRTLIDTAFMRRDARGRALYYGILIDITERKRLERQLLDMGLRDPLTGCFNRRYLTTFEQTRRSRSWACIVLDVDDFKGYNDRYGHERGDQVLVRMARFLSGLCRAEDAVVRLGGDEFVILFAGVGARGIDTMAHRLRRRARRSGPVPFSMGWAARWRGERLESTIARADERLVGVRVDANAFRGEQRRARRR
ncbi:MAG: GGDEF domain-containing protein [Deltaproteobacteria bacterium]|nr:GGDEF domain-containing protein [Deltaproteobacteria bacterium]